MRASPGSRVYYKQWLSIRNALIGSEGEENKGNVRFIDQRMGGGMAANWLSKMRGVDPNLGPFARLDKAQRYSRTT